MSSTVPMDLDSVAEWIRQNPSLLLDRPDLIEHLELPQDTQAVSLIHHQLSRLRRRNQQLEQQLKQLAGIAGDNERLMQRLHQLTLEVMVMDSNASFLARLFERLASDFQAEEVRLHLGQPVADLDDLPGVVLQTQDRPDWFEQLLDKGQTYCGRMTRQKIARLFPEAEHAVASCALVPIPGGALLAIGSTDQDRFHPGMGTLFIELLGRTIACRLQPMESDDRKRA